MPTHHVKIVQSSSWFYPNVVTLAWTPASAKYSEAMHLRWQRPNINGLALYSAKLLSQMRTACALPPGARVGDTGARVGDTVRAGG